MDDENTSKGLSSSELVVVVPTRARPEAAKRLLGAFNSESRATVIFVVDQDDPKRSEYLADLSLPVVLAPRGAPGIVWPLNWFLETTYFKSLHPQYVGFMGDDHLPRSSGWSEDVIRSLDFMGTGICYGNDLLQGENLPTAAFMTRDIVDILGFMAPPTLNHLWVDNYWLQLGLKLQRIEYLPDTIIEHLHPINGKAVWDPTYEECNNPNAIRDRLAFEKMQQRGMIDRDAQKILDSIA